MSFAKEEVLTSVLASESISQLSERNQLETWESLGKAPLENPASKKEEEVMPRLTSNSKAEISGQEKQENVHESAQLEHTGNPASSSKTPLLRCAIIAIMFVTSFCKKRSCFYVDIFSVPLFVTCMAKSYSISPVQLLSCKLEKIKLFALKFSLFYSLNE